MEDFDELSEDLPEVSIANTVFDIEDEEFEDAEDESDDQHDEEAQSIEQLATHPCYIVYHSNLLSLCNNIKKKCGVKGCTDFTVPLVKKRGSAASVHWVSICIITVSLDLH